MKKFRQGRIMITLREHVTKNGGSSRESAYLKEVGVDRETKTDGINETGQYHQQHRFRYCDRKDATVF